jgi:hypothetical protein
VSVPFRRLIAPFFAAASLALIPWTVWLSLSLPAHHESENWRTVWAGFDLALAAALGLTAVASIRDSPWLEAVAAVSGTLLCTDAWFDVTLEAGGRHLTSAIIEAVVVELPLALICFSVALDAEEALARALPTSPAGRRGLDRASPHPRTPDPHPQGARSPGE